MKALQTICFFLLVLVLPYCLPVNAHGQTVQRLLNGWEFLRGDLGGIWEAVRPAAEGSPESVPKWTKITLPHCVNARDAVDPDENYYQGPSWYRTRLSVANPYPKGRTRLHFEGAGQETQVYIYTTLVGTHKGGYDEFDVDITDAVAAFQANPELRKKFRDSIPLSIRVDNSRDLEMIPSDLSDFTLYGGIYRYLNLEYQPALSLDRLLVSAEVDSLGKSGRLLIRPVFHNPAPEAQVLLTLQLKDPQGKIVKLVSQTITTDSAGNAISLFVKKPFLWSPGEPSLYTVEATVGNFRMSVKTGFRHFRFVTHGPFLLNGKRLLLRGTHRHEDHAGLGAAMTEELMRREMIMIKDMGANFIRLAHYQQSSIILNLCDSLGILVWEEIPWCRGGLGGAAYQEQARQMLRNMITQHFNHPSVIIWGLGNENDWPGDFSDFNKNQIRAFMHELNDLAHALDSNRKTAIRRCDFCSDLVDVYSPSIWAGWYRGIYTEYRQITETEMKKVDHFLHAEWGGDSHAGRFAENPDNILSRVTSTGAADERAGDASLFGGAARVSKDGDWSESYICNLFDWHLKEQETMPWLTGSAQWVFKDFATPLRPDNPIPYVNQKGVVQRDLTPKEAYYVFQSYWASRPMAHIFGHGWPVRWGKQGEEKMIKVYSNCAEAELFVNGKSYGVRKRQSQDFPAAGLRWTLPLQQGDYQVKVIARSGKEWVSDSLQFYYQTAEWGPPARAELEKLEEKDGLITARVQLFDKDGITCLDSRAWVRFAIAGDADMLDDLGTSSGSRYVQVYNGQAIIRVRSRSGSAVLTASIDDLPVAILPL